MTTLKVLLGCACLVTLFSVQPAHAQLVSYADRVTFDSTYPGANVENWDEYSSGKVIASGSTLNGITYSTNDGNVIVTGSYLPSTSPNTIGETTNGFFAPGDTVTFKFSQSLSAFSIDINTYATDAGDYTATLSNGDIADSSFDPFAGDSTGEFIGFSDATPFNSITISSPSGIADTLDTLQYVNGSGVGPNTSPVPEPSTVALMLVGLMGVGVFAARRKLLV